MNREKLLALNNYGKLSILSGMISLLPIVVLPFYPHEVRYAIDFIVPAVLAFAVGWLFCRFGSTYQPSRFYTVTQRKSTTFVLNAWLLNFILGAIPFVLGGQLPPLRALFESVSGFTTCGLSTINVAECPMIFLFHRSLMQFVGGFGFIVLFLSIVNDRQSMDLFSAEGHPDKLRPNLQITTRTILKIYMVLLAVGTGGFAVMGMPLFDALNHTMCALSTGGFSTQLASFTDYSSAMDLWLVLLMLLGTTNTVVLLMAAQRKFKAVYKNTELRFLLGVLVVSLPIMMLAMHAVSAMSFGENFVYSLFNAFSALSTSGFALGSYEQLPHVVIFLLTLLMIFGGGMGSTAGGLKLTRVYIFLRTEFKAVYDRLYPKRKITRMHIYRPTGADTIKDEEAVDAVNYVSLYIIMYCIGVLLTLIFSDCQLHEAMFEFASCLSTVGLSIGVTAPDASAGLLIVEIIGMLMGRLEILPVLYALKYGRDGIADLINGRRQNPQA